MIIYNTRFKDLCKTHSRLFKHAVKNNYDMEYFTKVFMNSEILNLNMDDGIYSAYQVSFPEDIVDMLIEEENEKGLSFPKFNSDKNMENEDIASWIGEMYRYIQENTKVMSKDIYDVLSYGKMKELWISGHTLSDEIIVEELSELVLNNINLDNVEMEDY